ncbi:excinuclease ABC subunit A [Orenia metallireducens]|uniref:UvrABC system protein A n=1 Tax=Orenia metallireducens TaxID=1413210 RepID=A0A285H4Y9_9FIRM|nr:excinuclease ABC subunit UvrA [Orenia metallireducens]PRX28612.1 excinuclease ABC subunit A [Orenia metallireducens]SNY30778.1 excinuclease ABC subunit A [Orenia metallireducens]
MAKDKIIIKGAKEHNLQNIDVEIPRDKLVVITGLSGSGKSSLAFDTIYAEGQRRYVESLSAYARQFLGQMEKPKVEYIEGLSPSISIDQKTTSKNPRSTVGTVTEIHDYLRLLYARIGTPHCPSCGQEITSQTVQEIVDQVMELPERTKFQILAPIVRGRKGEYKELLARIQREGFVRVRVDGEIRDIAEEIELDKNKKHSIEVVVDRLIMKADLEARLAESLERALELAEGLVVIDVIDGEEQLFSENFACPDCGISLEELSPRMFSFNSPYGACDTCDGLGNKREFDPDLILDYDKSLNGGAIIPWQGSSSTYYPQIINALAHKYDVDPDAPLKEVDSKFINILLYGDTGYVEFEYTNRRGRTRTHETEFEGLIGLFHRRARESKSESARKRLENYMSIRPCPDCGGNRLRPESLAVTVSDKSIAEISNLSIEDAYNFFTDLELVGSKKVIATEILKEIRARLSFLFNVGLGYLNLSRNSGTLSGGEAQRIRLATQIGSSLVGVIYILDEPSIGLHQRDNERLINTLEHLRDVGNTVIVVEHDEDTIRTADHILDIGPKAGRHGGKVVAAGTAKEIMEVEESITGQYLSGKKKIEVPVERLKPNGKYLEVKGAKEHNLKDIDIKIPLGTFTCVTGVSGSGKSTLVNKILNRKLMQEFYKSKLRPGKHDEILGIDQVDKVINIDQSPIGRTPRSNPATYTKVFDYIRDVFTKVPLSQERGYKKGRFSFNVKGGRCEACKGDGIIKIEMHFLADVYVPCEVCKGERYNRETLDIKYKGKTIADVLDMTVEEALEFFENIPTIKRRLQTLYDVGLSYIRLGQPSTTLSGGEAQRIKLATELSKMNTGNTIYILDEPTTGLHFEDVNKLLQVLQRLKEGGNTILVIEHNLDVIKSADYIIDLGPEGGVNGGEVIATGSPEEVAEVEGSYTGQFLKKIL